MSNEEAKIIHQRYAKLKFTHDEKNAISDCYMQGTNRDGHVWVTWTDVERMLCDMADADKYAWHDLRKNPEDLPEDYTVCLVARKPEEDGLLYEKAWYYDVICGDNCREKGIVAWRYTEPFEEGAE